jgi:nicotinate-nucleotide adenylyltransferase
MEKIQKQIDQSFRKHFGRTPLAIRLDDIIGEALELHRAIDLTNMKEEIGDLLSSVLQLCNENEWDAEALIQATLNKIERRAAQYHSLGRKTKVAILGGAFDPITKGHIAVAKYVLDASRSFDEIWLMPCFHHMLNKNMATPEHRLDMCELACQVDGRIKTSNYEILHRLKGETYHLAHKLFDEPFAKDEFDFSFIIGMDNANTFDKWFNYENLEKLVRFVVVPRAGVVRNEQVNWYLHSPHIYLGVPDKPWTEVSSTLVREKLLQHEAVSEYLDPKVIEYIERNHLYV